MSIIILNIRPCHAQTLSALCFDIRYQASAALLSLLRGQSYSGALSAQDDELPQTQSAGSTFGQAAYQGDAWLGGEAACV